jgi:hypothetical protein
MKAFYDRQQQHDKFVHHETNDRPEAAIIEFSSRAAISILEDDRANKMSVCLSQNRRSP